MPKFLSLGLVQTKVSSDQKANLKKTLGLVESAAKKGAKIICLQELYRTLYFPKYPKVKKDDFCESIPGESTRAFSAIAKKYKCVIIVPIFEKDHKGQYHNSAAVINTDGNLMETYHKTHIPQDPLFYEKNYFKAGDTGYKIYKTKYATFAVLICFDQWFPEAARSATLAGAELIFYPTAIGNIVNYHPKEGDWHDAWETIMRGHSIANSVYIAAVNRVGKEDELNFWGQSFICNSFGKVIKRASGTKEETIIQKVDLSANRPIRESWGFFRNRRPDTYKFLTK